MSLKLVILIILPQCILSEPYKIGGLFYKDSEDFKYALQVSGTKFNFTPTIQELSKRGDILEIKSKVCALAEEGVIGIIDGIGGRASEHIQAVCDSFDLPHVVIQHTDLYTKNWSVINLYPSYLAFNMLLENLIRIKDWNNFTVLYVKGHAITRVSNLFKMGNNTDKFTVTVRELYGDDYRDVLINAKKNGYTNFVVDCPSRNLEQVLWHAQQVGLMADEHSYIFVSPDIFTLDLNRYRYGGVNITGFRLINLEQNQELWDFTSQFNINANKEYKSEELKTSILLIHDAVQIFLEAMKKLGKVKTTQLSCENELTWEYGSSLLNFMKTNKIEGLTRSLLFDGLGQRTSVNLDILELTPAGNQTIGKWAHNRLYLSRPYEPLTEITGETIMKNKTFRVLISTTPPYGYVKESTVRLEGNDRYEGFTVDLIEKLSEILEFNYEFAIQNDYGTYNFETHVTTGMVHELRTEKADFAICDFTITVERQAAIDFSMPFMSLGIGILYKTPSKQPPEMFSFMAVFSHEVWYYMVLVQLGLGFIMILVGRISHKEWQNPVPCIEQPEELTNQFSFANSVWLIIGSVMQQGSEIAPIAVAPRMITSIWWFFTMVMVASYTGTLVAFLTVETNVLPFESITDLAKTSIAYGCKEKGSTVQFFKETKSLNKMYEKMKANKWLVKDNDVGVELAENTSYAFFMESTSIEYYKERHCDLLQVGGLLDSKSYGIGMIKGSPYKKYIDQALLQLKEGGVIQKLKDIWWKENRGGGKCQEIRDEEPKQLGMKNMLGAFVVLGAGCLIGLFISILDMLWGVFKRSVKYDTSFKYELVEELKFALKFSGDVKPLKRGTKTDRGSMESLTKAEEKDELRSLKSLRSGNSTDTHRTHHSHSSKHSSSGLSIAFARRREY